MTEQTDFEESLQKLKKIEALGYQPYAGRFERTHSLKELSDKYSHLEKGKNANTNISVAGRVRSVRGSGKLTFIDIQDASLDKFQAFIDESKVGSKNYELVKLLSTGDFIGVRGDVIRTTRGELSVLASDVSILTKALLHPPHELSDPEVRGRQRYVDFFVNTDSRRIIETRSRIIDAIREYMRLQGFLEVETPMLHPIAGGATAKPFITFHNALGQNFYLRVAPELYLKRLIVGGFEKIFEINRNFRNEGISFKHNPEFTMFESYWAYADYTDNMRLVEQIFEHVTKSVFGTTTINYQGKEIDFKAPYKRISMLDAIKEKAGIDVREKDAKALVKIAKEKGLVVKPDASWGEIVTALFEELVEKTLVQPTFVTDHPTDISPLAKKNPNNPETTERFEFYVNGMELANGYSELADPIDQRQRFERQMEKRAHGDEEANEIDEDFIRALTFGMPPTSGLGIGIDRMTILLTNSNSIREVIAFPTLRTEKKDEKQLHGDEVKDTIIVKKEKTNKRKASEGSRSKKK